MPRRLITESEYVRLSRMTLGERVRYIREQMQSMYGKTNYTTTGLGRKIGVTSQAITAIERGETSSPSFKVMVSLSRAFGVPVECFSDEYYQEPSQILFAIGSDDSDPLPKLRATEKTPNEASFRVGICVYQLLGKQNIRIVLRKETEQETTAEFFVQFIARLYLELSLLQSTSGLDTSVDPYAAAKQLFDGLLAYPMAFPIGDAKEFVGLISGFIEKNRTHRSNRSEGE
ncbi:helix-turn-helix transcriptional regulator [Alicyclobacillus dauci]|uniref:Helix-turn-helix domain-containing protein n=1 Tax=Alicyclobacillus dauci TaxID=1475485 RepID=A0ABY6Z2B0_9BACL|nr:helix-turn-helix transcriptional regulator [Alicyclobacillus dauci]WAH36977.1 helix-turn-helix domain-containing protein [Alicyclobacillus dauci]